MHSICNFVCWDPAGCSVILQVKFSDEVCDGDMECGDGDVDVAGVSSWISEYSLADVADCRSSLQIRRRSIRLLRVLIVDAPKLGDLAICPRELPAVAVRHGRAATAGVCVGSGFAFCHCFCGGAEGVDEPVADPGWVGAGGVEGDFEVGGGFFGVEHAGDFDGVCFALPGFVADEVHLVDYVVQREATDFDGFRGDWVGGLVGGDREGIGRREEDLQVSLRLPLESQASNSKPDRVYTAYEVRSGGYCSTFVPTLGKKHCKGVNYTTRTFCPTVTEPQPQNARNESRFTTPFPP
ncbi:hypothetical protein J1614_001544 [Plenodomus biglobosus]|nr:hypothetical protein J1614_001544 [Plenodomus biglobosus]